MCHSSDNMHVIVKKDLKQLFRGSRWSVGQKFQTSNTWILSFMFCKTQENGRESDLSKEK